VGCKHDKTLLVKKDVVRTEVAVEEVIALKEGSNFDDGVEDVPHLLLFEILMFSLSLVQLLG
jgi:hypothetical protein